MWIRRIAALAFLSLIVLRVQAQSELYGFVQLDYIEDLRRVHPDWRDTLRPTRIPTTAGLYGDDGETIFSIRNTRLGWKGKISAGPKPLNVQLELELYGTGDDAGKTIPRLRHAYGQWGALLAGQTWSAFMDIDVFPNVLDKWGPNGLVLLRNPQIRWTPLSGTRSFSIAIEKPASDIDVGVFNNIDPALGAHIRPRSNAPDVSAHYRATGDWGHVQIAGIYRPAVGFESPGQPENRPKGTERGWGVNATSRVRFGERNRLLLSVVYGEAIGTYLNDGGTDIGPDGTIADPRSASLPRHGVSVYYDRLWSERWSSTLGYSVSAVDNLALQTTSAFRRGDYASVNLLHLPAKNITMGAELLWGRRTDSGGASGKDVRLQVSFKYAFSNSL